MEIQETPRAIPRLIRSNATGLYFVESEVGAWVNSPNEATRYDRLTEIVEVCRRHGLSDVELVARPGDKLPAADAAFGGKG